MLAHLLPQVAVGRLVLLINKFAALGLVGCGRSDVLEVSSQMCLESSEAG